MELWLWGAAGRSGLQLKFPPNTGGNHRRIAVTLL
jgi:hypothetical protein